MQCIAGRNLLDYDRQWGWTSTSAQERQVDMNSIAMDKIFFVPFVESAVILGHDFERNGELIPSLEVRLARGTKAWFWEAPSK